MRVFRVRETASLEPIMNIISRHSTLTWSLVDQMIISGMNFVVAILLARHLGVSQFGQFSLVWLVVVFVQGLQQGATTSPMMSIGPKQSLVTYRIYYSVVFAHQLIFAVLSTAFVIAGLLVWDQFSQEWNVRPFLWPLCGMVFIHQTQDFLRRYFFAINKSQISVILDFVRYGGQALALLLLFLFSPWQPGVAGVLWTMLIAASASILVVLGRIDKFDWSWAGWWSVTRRHWNFSKWNVGIVLAAWMSGQVYYFITGALLGSSAVGILNAAQTIMGVTNVLFQAMQNFMPVRASIAYRDGGIDQLGRFLWKCGLFITSATAVIVLILCVYPNQVMKLFYGSQFGDYGWVLVGYGIICIVTAIGTVFPIGLVTLEKTFPILLSFIISASTSIVIMYPLVSEHGLIGVLVGLTVYPAIQSFIQFFAFQSLVAKRAGRAPK